MAKNSLIYEINTWVWLDELARKHGAVTLACVPEEEWDRLAELGFDTVWLMGVWERSPAGVRIAREHPDLQREFAAALPDFTPADIVGSPYAVHRYIVDEHLGGPDGLRRARAELGRRGIRLMLDFVPNHVATDHPWAREHPEYFVHDNGFIAHGRDPYFPPWTDTAQLNLFRADTRRALIGELRNIARQCDGVRCDMAMLVLNDIFLKTWGGRAGAPPPSEFWPEAIAAVRCDHPLFTFMAEAYWDLEHPLQQLGFDYCYDKRLLDRLASGDAAGLRLHLAADLGYQHKLARLLENHDEKRAAAVFPPDKLRAAAIVIATVPGATLIHEGQLEGRRIRVPVQLGRRAREPVNEELLRFYKTLLCAIEPLEDEWRQCDTSGWPDNPSHANLLAWSWRGPGGRLLVVINYSNHPSQGRVRMPWSGLAGRTWRLQDPLTGDVFDRDGAEMEREGLYVDLAPWRAHFLRFQN